MESETIRRETEQQSIELVLFLEFIENLECSLDFPLQFNVKVEFHDNVLKTADSIVTVVDATGTIDLEVPFNLPLYEISEYGNFDSHPMLIYFELQNGQKATYNNNIAFTGQTWVCVVDLLPLVYDGNGSVKSAGQNAAVATGRYPMKAVGELNRNVLSNTMARLSATVSCPDVRLRKSAPPENVLGITVHGLYNPRNASGLQQHASSATKCSATLNVPAVIDPNFDSVVFARGTYADRPSDVNDLRWYSLDTALVTVSTTGQRHEEYDGPVANSVKIPVPALYRGPRFEWNLWRRSFMSGASLRTFQDFIFMHRYLPVTFEFNENPSTTTPATGKKLKDELHDKVVFVALLDLSMLLRPDCTSVRCLSIVHTVDAESVKTKGVLLSLLDDFGTNEIAESVTKITGSGWHSQYSAVSGMTSSCETLELGTAATECTLPFAVVDISVDISFYDQYTKHLTASMYELSVIPENPPSQPTVTTDALSKLNKYRDTVKLVVEKLLDTTFAGKIDDSGDPEDYVDTLRLSGIYDSLQRSLCGEIRTHVKEHYGGPLIGDTAQSFVNRIFMDLVDDMKKTVESFEFPYSGNKTVVVKSDAAIAYAREADELQETERARKIYMDLISTAGTAASRGNPNYWLLYASFCSRRLDFDTALECVKEVLLVDGGNRIGFFLCAAIWLTVHEDNDNGEIVLKSLIVSHGDFSEAYALLSVRYSILKMYEVSYVMLQRAQSSVGEDVIDKNSFIHENLLSWQSIGHNNDPLIKCAILLLELGLVKLATQCLLLVKNQCKQYHYYMAVCEYKNGNYSNSLKHLKNAKMTEQYKIVGDALKCLNCVQLNEPPDVLEKVLSRVANAQTPPSEQFHLVYLTYARHYYENASYAKGTAICQMASTVLRTPMVYTLLAKCLIGAGEIEAAEEALTEVNTMDVKNEEAWAYLTAVNVKMGNADEAKVCYTRALQCGLKPKMKQEIDTVFRKNQYTLK